MLSFWWYSQNTAKRKSRYLRNSLFDWALLWNTADRANIHSQYGKENSEKNKHASQYKVCVHKKGEHKERIPSSQDKNDKPQLSLNKPNFCSFQPLNVYI